MPASTYRRSIFRTALAAVVLGSAALPPMPVWAWGATGHAWVSGIAVEKLPESVPAFIRTPEAAAEIVVMGRELDRSKGAGKTHDVERDPGHSVDLADDGLVEGILPRPAAFGRGAVTLGRTNARATWALRSDMLSRRYTTEWEELLAV